MKKVVVTGAKGFVGKNLCKELISRGHIVYEIDVDSSKNDLRNAISDADFIVHLAGVNRPLKSEEFYEGNADFTVELCSMLKDGGIKIPIIFTSSIKALEQSDYGKSKRIAEDYLIYFSKVEENPLYLYRLSNVFGKWCRPNYNSVVATFCYNVAHDLPLTINDESVIIPFVYIDDIVKEFIDVIENGGVKEDRYLEVRPIYNVQLKKVVELLHNFKNSRKNLYLPDMEDGFERKLYATYLSYLEPDDFAYDLKMNVDNRGSFTEFVRTFHSGQVSVNISHKGITKGNHWHHTKNEKFLVVKGTALIKFRKVDDDKIYSYEVDGDHLQVVDIPVGYTHSIENIGEDDLVTIMWASEPFDKDNPDTYFLEVEKCKN